MVTAHLSTLRAPICRRPPWGLQAHTGHERLSPERGALKASQLGHMTPGLRTSVTSPAYRRRPVPCEGDSLVTTLVDRGLPHRLQVTLYSTSCPAGATGIRPEDHPWDFFSHRFDPTPNS